MNQDEAAQLLAACASFDNRQPSAAAMIGWAKALTDVPLDADAFDAVARYYGTPPEKGERLWIQPADVRKHRDLIRRARRAGFVYTPPIEGERDPHYLRRYRGQLEAVLSGAVATPSTAPQLEGGPHPSVARFLEGAVRQVPGEDETPAIRRPGPLGIHCGTCKAPIGRPCKTPHGKERKTAHTARREAAGVTV